MQIHLSGVAVVLVGQDLIDSGYKLLVADLILEVFMIDLGTNKIIRKRPKA
ncbi:hypothetical protein HEFE104084_01880 [Helicobacter felis]